ncbi:ROK family protein [Rubritalea spongiae]|uniref:ROK family protein n=1 Tax=Rubritalea spongiae TaxID=430797 RepID=A0ABW5E3R8_9BACT
MASNPDTKRILVVDIGGSNIKLIATGVENRIKIPSDPDLTAKRLVKQVREATADWDYDVISLGAPCACKNNRPVKEPHNLGTGWIDFDFEAAFGKPTKVINDATMQAIGCYQGGTMLFLGFGTGLGTTLIKNGTAVPLEAGHLPYRKKQSFEDYVGKDGQAHLGQEKWNKHALRIIKILRHAFNADDVVLGGGNAKVIENITENTRCVTNHAAFDGGFRMWEADW